MSYFCPTFFVTTTSICFGGDASKMVGVLKKGGREKTPAFFATFERIYVYEESRKDGKGAQRENRKLDVARQQAAKFSKTGFLSVFLCKISTVAKSVTANVEFFTFD